MTLRLNGDSSGFTEIKAADAAGDNSIKLPASNGSAYQLLRNGTSAGELTYESDLRVDGTGNVGIGRDPVYSGVFGGSQRVLHIGGTAAPGIRITSDTSSQADFIIQAGNSGRATYIASLAENGDIVYFTRPTGGSLTERFRIKGAGQIALSANCPGIDFSGIQTNLAGMTSETLDSYEEGSWTPVIGTESGTPYTLSSTYARYVKVGKLVYVAFNLQFTAIGSGTITIISLPFSRASGEASIINGYVTSGNNRQSIQYSNYTSNYLLVRLDDGDSQINYWTAKNNWAATNAFIGTGVYETA